MQGAFQGSTRVFSGQLRGVFGLVSGGLGPSGGELAHRAEEARRRAARDAISVPHVTPHHTLSQYRTSRPKEGKEHKKRRRQNEKQPEIAQNYPQNALNRRETSGKGADLKRKRPGQSPLVRFGTRHTLRQYRASRRSIRYARTGHRTKAYATWGMSAISRCSGMLLFPARTLPRAQSRASRALAPCLHVVGAG
eukprot:3215117-Rhodomonas_salina.3